MYTINSSSDDVAVKINNLKIGFWSNSGRDLNGGEDSFTVSDEVSWEV